MLKILILATCLFSSFSLPALEKKEYEIEVFSENPRIYVIQNFLTPEECDHLIELAKPHLTPSTIMDPELEKGKVDKKRTSQGMTVPYDHQDPIIENIEHKIADLTQVPRENSEDLHIIHYKVGGEYRPHFDTFDPNTKAGASHLSKGGQRIATFLMYLNDPEEGGETVFPVPNVVVKPTKGRALLFYSCTEEGNVDPAAIHGSAPIVKGEKWIASRWLRERVYQRD